MQPDDIHWNDWIRILKGNLPWTFMYEVALRGVFLYFLLFFSMRIMGRRMASQLSRTEMAALVALAATVGIPMQSPDKGLLPALVAAGVIVGLHSLMTRLVFRYRKIEKLILQDSDSLIEDGCLKMPTLKKNAISKELIFAQLRGAGIKNLGCVKRLYYEATGGFTLRKYEFPKPGLSVIPDWDEIMIGRTALQEGLLSCQQCGYTVQAGSDDLKPRCSKCNDTSWVAATIPHA
jgi:uncharacterized membrane protein YcaP (DUF421 family)